MKSATLIVSLSFFFFGASVSAQGPGFSGSYFLSLQPSIRANGMAGASAAAAENDALALASNPGHLGVMMAERYFSAAFYPAKTNWLPQLAPDLTYDAKTFLFGFNLKRLSRKIPITLGVGYTKVFINLGEQIITGELDPTPLGVFQSWERANLWSAGAGIDCLIKAGIGWNFKNLESNLAPQVANTAQAGDGRTQANSRDFGFAASAPLVEIAAQVTKKSFKIKPGLQPFFDAGFGYAQSNIGHAVASIDGAQAEPLSKVSRSGISFKAGLLLSLSRLRWRIFSVERVNEAEQTSAGKFRFGGIRYTPRRGDINIWKHVILGKGSPALIAKKGWEFDFFELLSIRAGRYFDPSGRVSYKTSGFGVRLAGVLKYQRYFNPQGNSVLNFISRHFEGEYEFSRINAGEGHPLEGTKYRGIRLSIF